ncbi:acetylxylan esterase [bacterium]|jgi:hypothetical protein|nr:acetylxylan esterase [bacterium]MDA7644851.1 acetylxylan esterase [bacterium]
MKISRRANMKSLFTNVAWMLFISFSQPGHGANYDEAQVPNYALPELLETADGRMIKTAADWEQIRRPEILNLFRKQVFGKAPAAPESISFRIDRVYENSLNGLATQKEVTVFFSEDRQGPQMSLLLFIPNRKTTPRPAFIGLNFNGNHTVHPSQNISITRSWVRNNNKLGITDNRATKSSRGSASSRWAVEKIIRRGYAVVTAYYGDIDPDFDDGFENGLHSQFHTSEKKPTADEWGSIAAWAWGLSRALDYLELDSSIDHKRVSVIGHSRLGKTSLWAGATDQRFALVISNNSGCGGAALSRREFGETVARINTSFPHWFCDNFVNYNNQVSSLPVDQHMLIALCAPRPIYVASASEDQWADPKGEFLAAKLASPAYHLFGLRALEENNQPSPDKSVGDQISYHIRTGKHDVTDFDWEQYLDFADRHLQ